MNQNDSILSALLFWLVKIFLTPSQHEQVKLIFRKKLKNNEQSLGNELFNAAFINYVN